MNNNRVPIAVGDVCFLHSYFERGLLRLDDDDDFIFYFESCRPAAAVGRCYAVVVFFSRTPHLINT